MILHLQWKIRKRGYFDKCDDSYYEQMKKTFKIIHGFVDDGKSTLIGRLLYESKLVFEDQLKKLNKDNRIWHTRK